MNKKHSPITETRSFAGASAPRATSSEVRRIEGVAIVYETHSEVMYDFWEGRSFKEIIHRGAVTPELLASSDVLALYEHQSDKLLARSTSGVGTLELSIEEDGLHYRFDAPSTQLGEDMLQMIRRGDLRASSFAFGLRKGDARWEELSDGTWIRHIDHISYIGDVSIVATPAYSSTSVDARSMAAIKEEQMPKPPEAKTTKEMSLLERRAVAMLNA